MTPVEALRYAVFQDRNLIALFLLRSDARRYAKDMQEYAPNCNFEVKEQY